MVCWTIPVLYVAAGGHRLTTNPTWPSAVSVSTKIKNNLVFFNFILNKIKVKIFYIVTCFICEKGAF